MSGYVTATHFIMATAGQPVVASDGVRTVAAIVYDDRVYPDDLLKSIAEACRANGIALAGVLQHLAFEGADHRCDVLLEDLASGYLTQLFENRGSEVRGCRLDSAALTDATARIERSLDGEPQLLLLNKFGKAESEGEGMRDVIAAAIDRDIPVIIGVPARNLDAWRSFAGELSCELPVDGSAVQRWLNDIGLGVAPLAASEK